MECNITGMKVIPEDDKNIYGGVRLFWVDADTGEENLTDIIITTEPLLSGITGEPFCQIISETGNEETDRHLLREMFNSLVNKTDIICCTEDEEEDEYE